MKTESIDIATNIIFDALYESNINKEDKFELLNNLKIFLENYNTNIGNVEPRQKIHHFNDEIKTK